MAENYIQKLLKPHYPGFSATETKIADYFVSLGMNIVNKTLANLSEETKFSAATLFAFVRKLGFTGFLVF